MNRRESLKVLMAASGGLIALPAWADQWQKGDVATHPSTFSTDEQALLASTADTIIPQGAVLGALVVGVDKFLQKLFDDCYEPEVQQNIKEQLKKLDADAHATYGQPFPLCTQKQRETLLLKRSTSADKNEKDFFTLLKTETIRGFSTSRQVMVNILEYKTAPGHYYGCVNA
ncbi:gluconate 2-dehydrogenase subunit 3 family protein [Chryseolinea serpens]|nr:gluconate 2-dehydrogenase subunit 3 family protein [Chryseolinea serpens]